MAKFARATSGQVTATILMTLCMSAAWSCSTGDSGDGDASGDGDGDGAANGDGDGDSPGDGDLPGAGDGDAPSGGTAGDGDAPGSGGSPRGPGAGVTVIPEIPTVSSSGCGTVDPPDGDLSLQVGELERTYIVSLPDGYDPNTAYPVIFTFHGLGNSGSGVMSQWYFGLEQQGGTPSIFVFPDGLNAGDGTGWPNQDGRDVAFFDAMLADLKANYCIDEARVFSTGHSYGGIMSHTLACDRGDVLRAVAPVAGARWAQNSCTGAIAALGIHGNPDDDVSYKNGWSAISRIIEANGCDENSTAAVAPTEFCTSYACSEGHPLIWCEHQSGHDWPEFAPSMIKNFFDGF